MVNTGHNVNILILYKQCKVFMAPKILKYSICFEIKIKKKMKFYQFLLLTKENSDYCVLCCNFCLLQL